MNPKQPPKPCANGCGRMAIGRRTCTACLAAAQRERRRAESEELAEAAADRDMRCEIRARFLLAGIQLGRY